MEILRYKIEEIQNTNFDLLIIGGGINGCGIARDAASRGLKVILVDKSDFSSGCTAAPSRLIHGGLRYLEYLEFDLVRESLREREILLKTASHLVTPIKLTIPFYSSDSRKPFYVKAGMMLYDLLSYDKSLPSHKVLNAKLIRTAEPNLIENGLLGGVVYFDAQVSLPERLCLENILMAKSFGAICLNHFEVEKINVSASSVRSVQCKDLIAGVSVEIKSKFVINVSGPWVDNVCSMLSTSQPKLMGGTKGSHIITKKFKGSPNSALYVTASDGRPFFILPWLDYNLIGTTDEDFYGKLEKVHCTDAEKYYLMSETNRILKNYKINDSDILYTYSGVRPLPHQPDLSPGQKTRRHIIHHHKKDGVSNMFSIIGGKLTTYRSLSEEVVDRVFKFSNRKYLKSKTALLPIIGSLNMPMEDFLSQKKSQILSKYSISENLLKHLISIYGIRYSEVLDFTSKNSTLLNLVHTRTQTIKAEVYNAIINEMAMSLSDVIYRRTTLGFDSDLGEASVSYVLSVLKQIYPNINEEEQLNEYGAYSSLRKVSRILR